MKTALTLIVAALFATETPGTTQPASPDDRFHATFDRFIGEDWLFFIDLYDADGNVTYSSVDIRRFEYGIGGAFLIEDAYRMEDEVHLGIQLIGLDKQAGNIHLSTFFQWQPTALAEVSGQFTESGGVQGRSSARLPDGTNVNERFECEWLDDRWTCASYRIEADGSESISNRNYYCRRSDPECSD